MARIRIAQQGWAGIRAAERIEDITAGIRLLWVEIDGCRIEDVSHAHFSAANDLTLPIMEVGVIGYVEIVYLGADGTELASRWVRPEALGELDANALVPIPTDDLFPEKKDEWFANETEAAEALVLDALLSAYPEIVHKDGAGFVRAVLGSNDPERTAADAARDAVQRLILAGFLRQPAT